MSDHPDRGRGGSRREPGDFERPELTPAQRERLRRAYDDLMALATGCEVASVRAAARAGLAQVHAALNGQGLLYELHSERFQDPRPQPRRPGPR